MSVPQTLWVRMRSSLSLKFSPGRRGFGRDGLLDFGDLRVAPLDGAARQSTPSASRRCRAGGDGVLDPGRIMRRAGGERLLVAEDQQRLGRRLDPASLKNLGQQIREQGGFDSERPRETGRTIAVWFRRERAAWTSRARAIPARPGRCWRRLGPRARSSAAESLPASMQWPLALGHVDHVQRDDRRMAQFDDLGGVIEVSFEVGRIDDDDDGPAGGNSGRRLRRTSREICSSRDCGLRL